MEVNYNGVKCEGRVVYVEPNDFRREMGGVSFGNGDNIYWRPEDLDMSVDLQVIIPDRDSCGKDFREDIDEYINAKDDRATSFFRGTDLGNDEPFLTDSFTDISYQEITQNSAGSKEALGIKSIDIQFDSHFYPVVKIKMVDIRGASLMMPAEYNSSIASKEKTCQEFFKALFKFPYPRFALSVKGFYGSRVTFMLAVNDFQSGFNSQTGNFEVEVSFIGHMYGLYTDIPMSCLLVAPYLGNVMGARSQYWNQQTSTGGAFFFKDGTPIPTLKDFVIKYDKISDEFKNEYNNNGGKYENIGQVQEFMNKISILSKLLSQYSTVLTQIDSENANRKCEVFDGGSFKIYFTSEPYINLPSAEDFFKVYESIVWGQDIDRISLPIGFNEGSKLPWGTTNVPTSGILVRKKTNTDPNKSPEYIIDEKHPYYEKLTDMFKEALKNERFSDKYAYIIYIDNGFKESVSRLTIQLDNEKNTILNAATEELFELTKKLLGFSPSIENMVRMIFAHIDAFMQEYYNLLDTIRQKNLRGERNSNAFAGVLKGLNMTDDVDSHDGSYAFPPFTGFYQQDVSTNNLVRKYPYNIGAVKPEVDFVENIFKAIDGINKDIIENREAVAAAAAAAAEEVDTDWTPTSFNDLLESKNPYRNFNGDKNGKDFVDELLKFVWKRIHQACLTTKCYNGKKGKVLVTKDAENFWQIWGDTVLHDEKIKSEINEIIDTGKKNTLLSRAGDKELFKRLNTTDKEWKSDITDKEVDLKPGHYSILSEKYDTLPKELKEENGTKVWDYNVGCNFLSNIYKVPEDTNTDTIPALDTKGRKELFENNDYNRFFPILQFKQYGGQLTYRNYFADYGKADGSEKKNNKTFLAAFLGTNNIYRFKKDDSSVREMLKPFVLFIGERITSKGKNFLIDNGDFVLPSVIDPDNSITFERNGFTVDMIAKRDNNNFFSGYYGKWEDNWETFDKLFSAAATKSYKFKTGTNKNPIGIDGCASYERSDYNEKMIKFATAKEMILNIYSCGEVSPQYDTVRWFFEKVADKIQNETVNTNVNGDNSETESVSEPGHAKEESKEQLYYTLKNLYDKWLASYDRNRFKLNDPSVDYNTARKKNCGILSSTESVSEIQCFMYVDTFYNNIGNKLLVDPKTFVELLSDSGDRSVMQFIADMAQKNKLLFVALPVFSNMYDSKTIGSIFTPQSIYGKNEFSSYQNNRRGVGNTYVFMYTHEPSHFNGNNENNNSVAYKGDSFIFFDESAPSTLSTLRTEEENYTIPAFGVTFGKQDQMYFKNINVSMAKPRETEVSIANKFLLAENERKGDSRLSPRTSGQNLYSIYSNMCYDCTVDMMGCMNIMPLMYFQLNNIPLFRGVYRIYGVRHHIENGSVMTTFTGTRVSKNAIPINANVIDIESLINTLELNDKIGDGETSVVISGSHNPSTGAGVVITGSSGTYINANNEQVAFVKDDTLPVFSIPKMIQKFKDGVESDLGIIRPYNYHDFSGGFSRCATCVQRGVKAGTGHYYVGSCNGWFCHENFDKPDSNFVKTTHITGNLKYGTENWYNGPFEPGDICVSYNANRVMSNGKTNWGHIAIFDGEYFISDCVQDGTRYKSCVNGSAWSNLTDYRIYKYKGPIEYPDWCKVITFNISDSINVYQINDNGSVGRKIASGERIVANTKTSSCKLKYKVELPNTGAGDRINVSISGNGATKDLSYCVDFNSVEQSDSAIINLCDIKDGDSLGTSVSITISASGKYSTNSKYIIDTGAGFSPML